MSLPEPTHITPLIKDCLHGDAKAQFALYEQYHKAMYNVAWRIVKEAHEAEDVMQEAFISAFKKLDQFSGQVTFGAWLKKIVINKAIVAFRKQKKQDTISLEEEIYSIPASGRCYKPKRQRKKSRIGPRDYRQFKRKLPHFTDLTPYRGFDP